MIDKTEPREFDRPDGEKGWVATLLLGDETGTTRLVLWDEKAGAALEIVQGDVLEIIGRHPGKSTREIYALALRKASCEINCSITANGTGSELSSEPVDLDAVLLGIEEPRTFTKKDGTTGEMIEVVIGDASGTARIVAWAPELFSELRVGVSVHITGAKPDRRNEGRAYSVDDKSSVTVTDLAITVPFTPLVSVSDKGTYSIQGKVKEAREPRSFVTRSGSSSWVRNITVTDDTDELRVVLWGEKALIPVVPGDRVEVFHAEAKPGRFGGIELGVGRGSVFRIPLEEAVPIVFAGTIIAGPGCLFIDNGKERYIIEGDFPHGSVMKISGTLSGSRIIPATTEPVVITQEDVLAHLQRFRDGLKG